MVEKTVEGGQPYILDEAIGFIIRQVAQRHATIFTAHLGDAVTAMQWAALSKLYEEKSCSQNLLGRLTSMDAPTIKGVIERLRKRGLITDEPDPDHKRRLVIKLTDEGRAVVEANADAAHAISRETLRPLSPREEERFVELLKKLR